MLLDAIDHVQLAMPPGGEELATWFYEDVLGVPRVPKPPHLAVRGGCWFERGALRIHLGVQDDFVPATKAHPAFTVVDLDRMEAAITGRTAAMAVVHLYGNPVDMGRAQALTARHGLLLIEDAAQALGARWRGRAVGSLADVSAFSFYPTKNLGALGQGGAVTTGRGDIARSIRERRDQGSGVANVHVVWGGNERLHGMQAAFLRVKLRHLATAQRQQAEDEQTRTHRLVQPCSDHAPGPLRRGPAHRPHRSVTRPRGL